MKCDAARRLIDAFIDSELDSPTAMQIEEHLAGCAACKNLVESRQALSAAIKVAAFYAPVPNSLEAVIRAKTQKRKRFRFSPLTAGGMAFAVGVSAVLAIWRPWVTPAEKVVSDVLSQKRAWTAKPSVMDIESTDPKIVQTWFTGKVGFSPSVPQLNRSGFNLVGGRLSVIGGHTVPVIVYAYGQHDIDLFVTPGEEDAPIEAQRDGIHVRAWNDCSLGYWAVSGGTPAELTTFRREFMKHK